KTLCYDQDGNLLLGTDNGLYVYNKKDGHHHLVHDARNNATLAGDIVWNIFKDRDNNIWLGTDNGISLSTQDQLFKPYFLPSITQSGDGNQILYIRRDFNNSLWLGGTHGIIKIENLESENLTHQWFRMNDSQFPIPHNRIRRIYEDRLQRLWVATDRGLLLYDTIHEHFTNYYLAGDSSNWIYDIIDDSKGDLWIASFNGIYCVNGNIANAKDTLYPRYRYAKKDSLYNNDVYSIAMDSENNLWALVNNSHIDYINLTTRTVHPISQLRNSMNIDADFLFGDSTGRIWISTSNELFRITMNDGEMAVQSARLTNSHSSEVYAMAEVGEELWLTTSEGLFIVHKDTLKVQHIGTTEQYIAIYYDASIHKIWLGTTNKLVMIDPLFTPFSSSPKKIHVTKITINGEQEPDYELYQKESIVLKHNQNNLMISFSDYRYTNEKLMTFSFKLDDVNAQWMKLKGGENSILLPNLAPGNYKVFVTSGQISDEKGQIEPILLITIRPPWYLSLIAKCIYALIAGGLIWWISNFFLVRHRLRIEKEQRQTLIAQAQSKMQFFTNIAHEFKNPLSLIIAPSGKLLSENKKNEEKELLELIHSNALKLSSLIHFSIEAYQDESKIQESFIPSEVEFIEFTRSIFDSFKDSLRYGKQAFLFNANRDKIYVNVDVFKMESVLNNLFANACKYTPENGSITCSLEYDESSSNICIKVTDTGIGIPETELPFVFQRYYQSSRTAKMGFEGTGVGLSIVKDYTEIHKGRIHVISGDTGTTFTVTLPVERDLQHKEKEETHTYEKSMLDEEDNRPLIVIVEDDVSTANFIHEILKKDYRCVIAHNGKNGLKSCIDLQPDLIITDAMMPIMDGLEMCRRIRQHLPLASVPIILLTAKKDPRIEYQSAQLNVDAFISKPFDYSLLQARIIQLIGNKERLKQQVRIEHITNPEMDGEISADEKNLLRITKMIEDNLNDPDLSVDMLCKLSGISSKQLYRKIKQLTNMSTVEYIRSIRLKKAALLFNNGNFTVAEVMYTVGFSNASYFTRSFKAEFGKTPQEYLSGKKNNVMGETKSDSFVQ
ncbi:MAG: response regulator, partial [Tannerella sp.]|nr:response regulator [Tannerella sp.]